MKRKSTSTLLPDELRIAERLASARAESGFTQEALASVSGISRSAVLRYEQGKASPGAVEITKLAKALNKSPNYLLGGSDSFFPSQETQHTLAGSSFLDTVVPIALALQILDRDMRESLSALLTAMVRNKLTRDQFEAFRAQCQQLSEQLGPVMGQIDTFAGRVAESLPRPSRKR